MTTEENNGLGVGQPQQPTQPQVTSNMDIPVVFDEPFSEYEPLELDEPASLRDAANINSDEHNPGGNAVDAGTQNGGPQKIVFEEEEAQTGDTTSDPTEEEALIQKLRERGFTVEKGSDVSEEAVFVQQTNELKTKIARLDATMNSSNDDLIRLKLKTDYSEKYRLSGRENLINSPEFNEEIEAELSDMNDTHKSFFAENVKNTLKGYKDQTQNQLSTLEKQENDRIESIKKSNRLQISESLNKIYESGNFLGNQLTPEEPLLHHVHPLRR